MEWISYVFMRAYTNACVKKFNRISSQNVPIYVYHIYICTNAKIFIGFCVNNCNLGAN